MIHANTHFTVPRAVWLLLLWMLLAAMPAPQSDDEVAAVLVAAHTLPRGTLITQDSLVGDNPLIEIAFYPAEGVPAGALQRLDQVVGMRIRTTLMPEQPLTQHYLYPDQRTDINIPPAISPAGTIVTRTYGVYQTVTLTDLDAFTMPTLLAAGDRVDVVLSTDLGNILQDETRVLISDVVIAQMSPEVLVLSALPEQIAELQTYLDLGLPLTFALRAESSAEAALADDVRITWESLQTRDDFPLILPDGADLSQLGR